MEQLQRKVASDSLAHHLSSRKYEEGMLSVYDLHTTAQTLLQSRLLLLQSEMMLALKSRLLLLQSEMMLALKTRLVNYYVNGKI